MLDRVPYEIFSTIIKTSYKNFSFISVLLDSDETSLPPINATHVCRSWRNALLSDPTMWTCIRLKFIEGISGEVREILLRSGSAPLDVFIDEVRYLPEAQFIDLTSILPDVFQEMYRFRKLHMLIPTRLARISSSFLKRPAPMLQNFYLDIHESSGQEWDTLREAYQDLFLGDAPNLRRVHLQISAGFKEPQSISLLKDLSTLHLSFVSSTVIDGDILLGILHSSPSLRILNILFSYLRPMIVCPTPLGYRVSLPYLQELTLRGRCGVDNVNLLLGRLDFPVEKVDFDITCADSYSKISDSTLLLHFLAQRRLPLFSISAGIWSHMTFDFFEKIDLGSPPSSLRSKGSSGLTILYDHFAPLDTLSNLLRKFKISDITHMYLEIIPSEPAVLKRTFPLLEKLQHLRVHDGDWNEDPPLVGSSIPRSYLKALAPRLQSSNPQKLLTQAGLELEIDVSNTDLGPNNEADRRHVLPCLSLHTLELVFSRESDEFEERYFQELAQCCKIREQTGYPFKSISIFCERPAFAKSVETWLQANELTCSHVKVRIIASSSMDY